MCLMFNSTGILEPGIHTIEWNDFYKQYSFSNRRKELLEGLEKAIQNLKQANCQCLYIDGSFVTRKIEPGDYDACWYLDKSINFKKLDPVFLNFDNGRLAQKARFGGEFFPHVWLESNSGLTFLQFFQRDKNTGSAKGIVRIELED